MKIYKRVGKKGKVTYQAFWYEPVRNPGDKPRLRGKCFPTEKEAKDWLAKVRVSKRENKYRDVFDVKKETKTTFNELADQYVESFQGQKSFKNSKGYVVEELKAVFGHKLLSEITYKDLELYRNTLKRTPTRNGTIRADASINYYMTILGHILNKAVEWDLLTISPFKKGSTLRFKENNKRDRYLNREEILALLSECTPHLRPIVETALLTGMRRGELLGLKWDQIRNGYIYLTETKSGKPRQIPINDRMEEIFKGLRRQHQLKSGLVFPNARGRSYTQVRKSFQAALKRAGIVDFRFHDLRHTYASHLVMNGASLKAVQELLGHADIKMTMRYAHLSDDHLKASQDLINDLTGDIKKSIKKSAHANLINQ